MLVGLPPPLHVLHSIARQGKWVVFLLAATSTAPFIPADQVRVFGCLCVCVFVVCVCVREREGGGGGGEGRGECVFACVLLYWCDMW